MNCCIDCFKDPWLRGYVETHSTQRGECSFCSATDSQLITPIELSHLFENLLAMYHEPVPGDNIGNLEEPWSAGAPLIKLIQRHWDVFSDRAFESGEAANLLDEIAESEWDPDGGVFARESGDLVVARINISTMAEQWVDYCFEVMSDPWREIASHELPDSLFNDAADSIPEGTILYRARLGYLPGNDGDKPVAYSGEEMGPPPPTKAIASRANEQYRPVLYCADQEKTAVAEIRPARGLLVSVCEIRVKRNLKILDLSKDIDLPNPFLTKDLNFAVEMAALRRELGQALGKPLDRNDNPLEYLPAQRLAIHVKRKGFAGIRYPSARG